MSPTGQQKYYIISGQHQYTASQRIRKSRESEGKSTLPWTTTFRCNVLQQGIPLTVLQQCAGQLQARGQTIRATTLTETMQIYLKELKDAREANVAQGKKPESVPKTKLLMSAYMKSGKVLKDDGTIVCPCPTAVVLHWLLVLSYPMVHMSSAMACIVFISMFVLVVWFICLFGLHHQCLLVYGSFDCCAPVWHPVMRVLCTLYIPFSCRMRG